MKGGPREGARAHGWHLVHALRLLGGAQLCPGEQSRGRTQSRDSHVPGAPAALYGRDSAVIPHSSLR